MSSQGPPNDGVVKDVPTNPALAVSVPPKFCTITVAIACGETSTTAKASDAAIDRLDIVELPLFPELQVVVEPNCNHLCAFSTCIFRAKLGNGSVSKRLRCTAAAHSGRLVKNSDSNGQSHHSIIYNY